MVRQKDPDSQLGQGPDYLLDFIDGLRVDSRKGLVQKQEARAGCKASGYLGTAPFSSGEGVAFLLGKVGKAEGPQKTLDDFLLAVSVCYYGRYRLYL